MNNTATSIFSIFVALGIFFGYINPTWNGPVADTKAAIALDDEALSAANQYLAKKAEITAAYEAINKNDIAALIRFLPDSVDNVQLTIDLNALAARSLLTPTTIAVAPVKPDGTVAGDTATEADSPTVAGLGQVGSAILNLNAEGTFSALQDFLSGIEQSSRLLDMTGLSVTSSKTGVYHYAMKVRFYWLH